MAISKFSGGANPDSANYPYPIVCKTSFRSRRITFHLPVTRELLSDQAVSHELISRNSVYYTRPASRSERKMRILFTRVLLVAFAAAALGQSAPSNRMPSDAKSRPSDQAASNPATAAADTPILSLPYTPGLDTEFMDRSVDPCVDSYQYSCGGWMKKNPIPADQPTLISLRACCSPRSSTRK